MKKQISTFLFFITGLAGWSQTANKTTDPCTEEIAQNTPGEWRKWSEKFNYVKEAQKKELNDRIDIVHNILLKMYPKPVGVVVRFSRGDSKAYFGSTRRYFRTADDALSFDYVKTLPVTSAGYSANFSPHYCSGSMGTVREFVSGWTNENSDGISLYINDLGNLAEPLPPDDDWTINGLPVKKLNVLMPEKWKAYVQYGDERGRGRQILIHRAGMLPYIPVTRKQYLGRCIEFTTRLHDKTIEGFKQMPVRSAAEQEKEKKAKLDKFQKQFANDEKKLKANVDFYLSQYKTDQQVRDERVTNAIEMRDRELKVFTDELEKTTREGLLNSPAMILAWYYTVPAVFETDPQKGGMLITENPDYIRRDIPGYMPQFMVLQWKWNPGGYPAHKPQEKLFLEDFPVEKLQAIIDK